MNLHAPAAALVFLLPAAAAALEHRVADPAALEAALAEAAPGDTLVLDDGVWTDADLVFAANGTADRPITLRPQTPGGLVLTGSSRLQISGSHLVVRGLRFRDGALAAKEHVVRFRGPLGDATHCRLTETSIEHYNPADEATRYFWVTLHGTDNRVDRCRFEGQNHSGVTLVVTLDDGPARHRIDRNHFLDRPAPAEKANGFETLRLGTSKRHELSAQVVVEGNLFERCDGEIEIISNKSCDNAFRGNTFRASAGTLTLRHGHRAVVENNVFLGEGKAGSGGIRVIGEGHRIAGNYIEGVDDRAEGAISLAAGIPDTAASGYEAVRDVAIERNTVVHAAGPAVRFDWGLGTRDRSILPEAVTLRGNLFVSGGGPLFGGGEGAGWSWSENTAFGSDAVEPKRAGVDRADPGLGRGEDGLWRPADDGPAAGRGAGLETGPLHAGDVGPSWATDAGR